MGIAFRITMNTGQRFSTKVATAYFFFFESVFLQTYKMFCKDTKEGIRSFFSIFFYYVHLVHAVGKCLDQSRCLLKPRN